MIKVCHITTVHNSNDIRIFHKECRSLVHANYDVYHIAQGENREDSGVHVVGLGNRPDRRRERMTSYTKSAYENAIKLDCDIYHLHDPELLPLGLKIKKTGKKVIFDSHENVPEQILDKKWIPSPLRKVISLLYSAYETYVIERLDAVVAATPHIAEHFKGKLKNIIVINNYPMLDDIVFHKKSFSERKVIACYAGGISSARGEQVMIKAMEGIDGQLILAGEHPETERHTNYDKSNVSYLGNIVRKEVNELYGNSRVGVVLYQPAANHYEAQPIKMFEYMAAGLPVVASNFPLWKEIIEENNCGFCVDPMDVVAVHKAIYKLLSNPDIGQEMGLNGRKAVSERYNWNSEEKKLIKMYDAILH